jgi:hypothetical protein
MLHITPLYVHCYHCARVAGRPCVTRYGNLSAPHKARVDIWRAHVTVKRRIVADTTPTEIASRVKGGTGRVSV